MMPPTPLSRSVAPIKSGATSCTLRAKKSWCRRRGRGIGPLSWPGLQPILGRLRKLACPAIHLLQSIRDSEGVDARHEGYTLDGTRVPAMNEKNIADRTP